MVFGGIAFFVFIVYLCYFLTFAFFFAVYVLRSLGLYTVAQRRGIRHPWFAWLPVVGRYLEGCISDQYQCLVKGKNTSRRKVMLTLSVIQGVLALGALLCYCATLAKLIVGTINGRSGSSFFFEIIPPMVALAVLYVLFLGSAIAAAVFHYMAIYDLYGSCCPENRTLFLVLSIVFNVTEPFFIFFNRNREDGMPPRKPNPVFETPAIPADSEPRTPDGNYQEEREY